MATGILTNRTYLMKAADTYTLTSDVAIDVTKTYYTRSGSSPSYVYTVVTNPVLADIGTYYEKSAGAYSKLVDITDFPNLGGAPEQIDITTLSDMERHYINGIQEQETMSFTALYTKSAYNALVALKNIDSYYAVYFGGSNAATPTGDNGKFTFTGKLDVFVNGSGTNEAITMTITIAPTSAVALSE